ncbi:MAG: deoxyguanosinetriphosphate triphosphohydrolase [Solibacterales bacterium]|nr:deoxyguanosinetriphosphate triphosphohydrolase [Bryobacterales bacterium]|tara:strand:- start:1048 stop:2178 length:1131 start_codon:yes stop_codon:yes gene_type:complete
MLAHLSFPVAQSRGRRYREKPHSYRNAYQRDRDRIIHSRAFRRLEHKTQVFTSPDSDHSRNRLTHTIEVSQIARTVALVLDLNEDLVEALALCHDLGHPPFGHAGERVLDREMRRYGDGFDHNLHALRIVEGFEQRYAAFPGLNLSFEVREGIIKHSRDYDSMQFPELNEYMLDQLPTLEAQLIDLADEIAYNIADLDDAVDAELLDPLSVCREVPLFERCMKETRVRHPSASDNLRFHEALRALLDILVSGLICGTHQAAEKSGASNPNDVRQLEKRLACFDEQSATVSHQLKVLLTREVYHSSKLEAARAKTDRQVAELFQWFMSQPDLLPDLYQERTTGELSHRVVCDYIAGMTDKFLLAKHSGIIETSYEGD